MAYNVLVTEKAEEDLDGIVQYLTRKLCNPDAAISLLEEIEKLYDRLSENPYMYSVCAHPLLADREYRKAVLGGYLALYKVEGSAVYVARYFSGLEDYAQKI